MSGSLDKLAPALVAAQAEFLHVVKRATVQLTKAEKGGHTAQFAAFPDVVEHVRPVLNKHGLAFTQQAVPDPRNGVMVRTVLIHESGQTLADEGLFVPSGGSDARAFGSAHSYAKRYSLLSVLGVATDDDDGEAALRAHSEPLSDAEREELIELSRLAGVADAVARRRVAQIRRVDFEKSKHALEQRIAEGAA